MKGCHAILREGVLDLVQREVRFSGHQHNALTRSEAGLFDYLARHPGRVISREEILQNVWHLNPLTVTRTIDVHVSKLRKKLHDAQFPAVLRTVNRQGYLLILEARSPAC